MAGARVVPFWMVLVVTSAVAAQPRSVSLADPSPCAGVTCGGRGECIPEVQEPFCLCDEGYQAVDRTCVRAARQSIPRRAPTAGARVVDIASREVDRELASVGRSLIDYPRGLAQYLRPGGLWCSDFVSWVYRAAGVPFTGGYQGGWLLTNNVSIKRWFERNGSWVQRGTPELAAYDPQPGDYLRIQTPTWGHSVIVHHVEGTTIHAIEGNAGGRVRTTRYLRWRQHDRIDGFGIVALPGARHVPALRVRLPRRGAEPHRRAELHR